MAASRPTVVYVVMLGCSVVGLWVVLALGRNLKPAPNLSGQWELTSASRHSAKSASTMQVEQSGRFFQVSLDNAKPFGMQIVENATPSQVALRGKQGTMEFSGLDSADSIQLAVNASDAAHDGTWMIHRIKPTTDPRAVSRGGH